MASGIYQSTVFGLAAKLPFKYTGAVVLGTVSETLNHRINIYPILNGFFLFSESKWNYRLFGQHPMHLAHTKSSNGCNLLLHCCSLHPLGMLRHILCIATQRKNHPILHVNNVSSHIILFLAILSLPCPFTCKCPKGKEDQQNCPRFATL